VFDNLIESQRRATGKRSAGVGAISLIIHGVLIAGAVYATMGTGLASTDVVVDTTFVYVNQEQEPEQPRPVELELKGFQTVVAPTVIPTDIPPIDFQEKFDPRDFTGSGVEGGLGTGLVGSDHVYAAAVVDQLPELLSGPQPVYPPLLKDAQIEGKVVLEYVVDTTGRAQMGTIRVVRSSNPAFVSPVQYALNRSLFRPGRVHGRAVKVLVTQTYSFTLTR
jgi:protein TonB